MTFLCLRFQVGLPTYAHPPVHAFFPLQLSPESPLRVQGGVDTVIQVIAFVVFSLPLSSEYEWLVAGILAVSSLRVYTRAKRRE